MGSEYKIVFMASRDPAAAGAGWSRDFYRALGRAIRVARTEQGIERKELARLAGLSYPYLSEIEKGSKRPSAEALIPIAAALGLKQSELLQRAEQLLEQGSAARESPLSLNPSGQEDHEMEIRRAMVGARPASIPTRISPARNPAKTRMKGYIGPAAGEAPSGASFQELVSRVRQLGADDFHRVLDLVRRLAS